jgi:hypothetical protein
MEFCNMFHYVVASQIQAVAPGFSPAGLIKQDTALT